MFMRLNAEERNKLIAADISTYQTVIETLQTHTIIANLAESTRNNYAGYAKRFFSYLVVYRNTVPFEQVSYDDCREFVLYLVNQGVAARTVNCYISTLVKLFYCVRHESFDTREVPYRKVDIRLPNALTPNDFLALYSACTTDFEKALLCVLFSSGMRISEVLAAKFSDIKRNDLLIRVGPGKGRQERNTLLSQKAIEALEVYYRNFYRDCDKPTPDSLIFMKKDKNQKPVPVSYEDTRILLKKLVEKAGLQEKGYTLHSFRHGFAIELYRATNDVMLVSSLLGHKHLSATEIYVRLAAVYTIQEKKILNPLDAALNI